MLGAGIYGAESGGPKLEAGLLALDQAKKQRQQEALSANLIGNYLQQMAAGGMPNGAQAPSPGQPSQPKNPNQQPPGAAAAPASPGAAPQQGNAPMSLDGLMKFLADRGVTGEDAYATAAKFMPWLSQQDQEQMNQAKLNMDLQKLLVSYGWDQAKAKDAAGRLAAYRERTKVMQNRGAQQNKVAGLGKTAMKLTTGKQKLSQQLSAIVNSARNAGRPLTAQEQQAIDAINSKIQTVDAGIMAIRAEQAQLQGVDESQFGDDSMLQDMPDDNAGGGDSGGP